MAGGRKVYTLSRWQQCQVTLGAWLPGSLLWLFCVSAVITFYYIIPNGELVDVRGAAQQHGLGKIAAISYLPVTKGNTNPGVLATVIVEGDNVTFRTHDDLHQNERVQFTYRVGKSGRIHIDDIKPEGKTKP